MANVQYTHNVGHVGFQRDPEPVADMSVAEETPRTSGKYANLIGAVLSVSLIAGVGYWGYSLVMRDVTGIPVVRAAEGEMRTRPEDPGGQLAQHQGLAVNEVAAQGQASGPVDRLVLAPRPVDLSAEDLPQAELAEAVAEESAPLETPEVATTEGPADDVPVSEIDALVASLTEGVAPLTPVEESATPEPEVVAATVTPVARPAVFEGPGLKLSKRPQLRPAVADAGPVAVTPVAAVAPANQREVDAATLPVGTRLVQLGALDSPEGARAQWDRLEARFGDYMRGKDRVIMKAVSGDKAFYRLRAVGFADLAEARRFCAALSAAGADCIPVVTR